MSQFVPLETSIFDRDFTLDPYPFLQPLYEQEDILGFSSEGMNFLFRFEDCHDLIAAHKNVAREPVSVDEEEAKLFAEKYPGRAWSYKYSLTNIKAKVLLNRFLVQVIDRMSMDEIVRSLSMFKEAGRHDQYMDEINLLPMRILLTAWGFEYTEPELAKHFNDSVAMVKSFEAFDNEELFELGEKGRSDCISYVFDQFNNATPGTLLHDFAVASREAGFDDNYSVASLVTFMQSTANTLSVSTAFMMRNMLRFPQFTGQLRANPQLINNNIVMEFLRRDNHVKALSRQVHNPFTLRGRQLEVGESLFIMYPGVNMDPTHWNAPLELDLRRVFTPDNHNIFGGSRYACIGSRIALEYFACMLPIMLESLSENAYVVEEEIEVDGEWIAERVITKLPIIVP